MIETYITIGIVVTLFSVIVMLIAGGTHSPSITLFMAMMIGMMWPAFIVLWIIECYTDGA